MPHANDGSMHQYRRPSAGILFIPEELTFDPDASNEATDAFFEALLEHMKEPLNRIVADPDVIPVIVHCTAEQYDAWFGARRIA